MNDDDEENDPNSNQGPNHVERPKTEDHITCRLGCPNLVSLV
jgi:hypothetical protein